MEQVREIVDGSADRFRAKEEKGNSHKMKGHKRRKPIRKLVHASILLVVTFARSRRERFNRQIERMEETEGEECPTETMPKPDQGHIGEEAKDQASVAQLAGGHAQRHEDVISEPAGQSDVPAAPELGEA